MQIYPFCQGTSQVLLKKGGRTVNMNRCIQEKAYSKVKNIFHNCKMRGINKGGEAWRGNRNTDHTMEGDK